MKQKEKVDRCLLPHRSNSTFVSISFLIGVDECLSLIVDDHVYTGGETRVNCRRRYFFLFFKSRIKIGIRKFRRSFDRKPPPALWNTTVPSHD